jgi:alginate O-acetyltransferase complex protein AlgI
VAVVAANLCVLFWFKYAGFALHNVDALLGTDLGSLRGEVALPAGVSFFVFQAISYVVDVKRGDIQAERRLVTYGAYQAFFPHLIAGPIVRFRDVIDDFLCPRISADDFGAGVSRLAHGLLKKALIADNVAPIADAVFGSAGDELQFATAWLGALAYTIQIYFDFSGYSDMAIGMAQMFGIRFHENFARPYSSRSVTEFWRRWHISLSSWFRDYVYIPLGGNRRGTAITYRNLLIVFAVTGLWHGAAWTFVLWGLYHGAFLVLERVAFKDPNRSLRNPALRYLYCLPVVIFGWVLFRATTLDATLQLWSAMLSPLDGFGIDQSEQVRQALTPYALAALACGSLILLAPARQTSLGSRLSVEPTTTAGRALNLGYTVAALSISGVIALTGSYSPFLYFNF